ncbi:Alpha/Beta hydrolase protein [Coemansia mojavensis]|nr:Alpha/Beta hydrolase protein [Coemansia mojavensis]
MHADERIILHFHGGAYCVGERSLTHIHVYARISQATGLRVFSPNYRLAPRHCFPSQLHDCFLSYSYILSCGFKPENIVLSGDSAGGALAIGVLFLLRDMKLAMPKATVLISPWVDATCSGKSWKTSQHLDYLPLLHLEDPFHPTRMFYDPGRTFSSEMRKELQCPLVSPVFGTDLSGLPPMLIQMGSNERLRDDIQLFADKVKLHNPKAKPALEIYDNMPHAFVLFDFAEAAQQAFASIGGFVSRIKPLK